MSLGDVPTQSRACINMRRGQHEEGEDEEGEVAFMWLGSMQQYVSQQTTNACAADM